MYMSVLQFLRLYQRSITVAIIVSAFLVAVPAYAAELSVTPASGSYNAGQTFTARIQVQPGGDSINAVEADLTFDNDVLSVESVSKDGSVFTLWPVEPTFSNSNGTISFGGGHTAPIDTSSTVLNVTFRVQGSGGSGTVSFSDASVLAADGQGTDVYDGGNPATYTVSAAADPAPEPEPTPEPAESQPPEAEGEDSDALTFGEPPRAPEVGSQTFLDPSVWYNTKEGLFTWELPFDVNAMAVEIATSSDNEPEEIFDPPIEEFAISEENVSDGVQYLSIQFQNQVGWGAVLNRPIRIDTTPPEPFEIDVQAGTSPSSFPLLKFAAKDETSGIDLYELTIADREPVVITPDEAKLGYLLGELEDGTYTATVVARDKAGNETTASVPVLITAGWQPEEETEEETTFWSFITPGNVLILVLVLLVVGQFAYMIYDRRRMRAHEEQLRKEAKEIQDQMEKIFSALRDEIHDQINDITKRKRLSKKEKEAVESLNQALEVSETLIEKEVNDVKKLLR